MRQKCAKMRQMCFFWNWKKGLKCSQVAKTKHVPHWRVANQKMWGSAHIVGWKHAIAYDPEPQEISAQKSIESLQAQPTQLHQKKGCAPFKDGRSFWGNGMVGTQCIRQHPCRAVSYSKPCGRRCATEEATRRRNAAKRGGICTKFMGSSSHWCADENTTDEED